MPTPPWNERESERGRQPLASLRTTVRKTKTNYTYWLPWRSCRAVDAPDPRGTWRTLPAALTPRSGWALQTQATSRRVAWALALVWAHRTLRHRAPPRTHRESGGPQRPRRPHGALLAGRALLALGAVQPREAAVALGPGQSWHPREPPWSWGARGARLASLAVLASLALQNRMQMRQKNLAEGREGRDAPRRTLVLTSLPASPGSPLGPAWPCGPPGPCSPVSPRMPWKPCGPAGPGGPGGPRGPTGPTWACR